MAKTFTKIAKTFVGLSVTVVAKGRRLILILHLEAKYAKMDYKNEIYMKNWVRSTSIAKSKPWQKSTINFRKVNSQTCQSQQSNPHKSNDDVSG